MKCVVLPVRCSAALSVVRTIVVVSALIFSFTSLLTAQTDSAARAVSQPKATDKKWYDNIALRGYIQVRYNRLLETNPNLGCEQCDKSWGKNGGVSIRRARLIFSGQISHNIFVYIQPDFASSAASDRLNFAQLRDAYFDIGLDDLNEFRFRIGQSKIPYGFENLQSSQNRLPLDRVDALNSAVPNERDLGAFFYWAPKEIRDRFSSLVKTGLKGTGDYGVLGVGIFNGQTANQPELNDNPHVVARASYPFNVGGQIIEAGVQGYSGTFVLTKSNLSTGVKTVKDLQYLDQRVAASITLYPKPFGIQAEYNVGKGPEFNPATDSIEVRSLTGGYVLVNYPLNILQQTLIPFARVQYYEGGKKIEKDARSYKVNETEIGIEWQPLPTFELVASYTISTRRYQDFTTKGNEQNGNLLRLQAQVNL